jgi:hypothetical protein
MQSLGRKLVGGRISNRTNSLRSPPQEGRTNDNVRRRRSFGVAATRRAAERYPAVAWRAPMPAARQIDECRALDAYSSVRAAREAHSFRTFACRTNDDDDDGRRETELQRRTTNVTRRRIPFDAVARATIGDGTAAKTGEYFSCARRDSDFSRYLLSGAVRLRLINDRVDRRRRLTFFCRLSGGRWRGAV